MGNTLHFYYYLLVTLFSCGNYRGQSRDATVKYLEMEFYAKNSRFMSFDADTKPLPKDNIIPW